MRKTSARCGALRRVTLFVLVLLATCLGAGVGGAPVAAQAAAVPPTPPEAPDRRLVFTYYYYWYDSITGGHLREEYGLSQHFPAQPAPNWRSVDWHKQQLADMAYAGIDVTLPVYWGFDRPDDVWSTEGLAPLTEAWRALKSEGENPPTIGMFFDTAFLDRRDLTTAAGREYFYANFKDFFQRIPREQWALINGRPVVYLFTSDFIGAFNQATFDHVYARFQADFGVRPYIVREMSWDYPFSGWAGDERLRDFSAPIRTENSYLWAASIFVYRASDGVAAIGPGYDDTRIPGRQGWITPRWDGEVYRWGWETALASGKPLLAIETWNEFHEGSGIAESKEYGRQYLDITREYTARFKATGASSMQPIAQPEPTATPVTLDFGNQNLGTTSAAKTVTLANDGAAALSISGITASGDFSQTNTCGGSIAPGASCTISVVFRPTSTGSRTGALTIADNAAGSPRAVALGGNGVAPAVSLTPTSLSFGNQRVGTTSAAKTLTLTNSGTGTLSISSIAATGDFARTTTCGGTLAPGASCTITITFKPTARGTRNGTLTIVDNAGGSPRRVTLTGSGT